MIIVDTNVLLRASLDDDPQQSELARRCLADAEEIVVPLYAFCEFVSVLVRSYRLSNDNIATSVLKLVRSGKVLCDEEAVSAGLAFLMAGGDFTDGVIEFEGRRMGGKTFVTFDRQAVMFARSQSRACALLDAG